MVRRSGEYFDRMRDALGAADSHSTPSLRHKNSVALQANKRGIPEFATGLDGVWCASSSQRGAIFEDRRFPARSVLRLMLGPSDHETMLRDSNGSPLLS